MANLALWNLVSELKSEKYKWVDLTHELSPETPHWYGFNPLEAKLLFDYGKVFIEILVVSCELICPVDFLSTKTGRKERISITQISIISISIITLCF